MNNYCTKFLIRIDKFKIFKISLVIEYLIRFAFDIDFNRLEQWGKKHHVEERSSLFLHCMNVEQEIARKMKRNRLMEISKLLQSGARIDNRQVEQKSIAMKDCPNVKLTHFLIISHSR